MVEIVYVGRLDGWVWGGLRVWLILICLLVSSVYRENEEQGMEIPM